MRLRFVEPGYLPPLSDSTSATAADKRVALVTGANKGIGLEVARQLGRDHDMTVLIGARDARRRTS